MKTEKLVWLDLETTGLDPLSGQILEIGIAITDRDLKTLAERDWTVHYPSGDFDRSNISRYYLYMTPEVRAMHEASGLLGDCARSTKSLAAAGTEAIDFIEAFGAKGSPLCGSSVHFDRAWLAYHLPRLLDCFHYRNFDASVYRIEAEILGRTDVPPKPTNAHRALVDVHASIELARWGMRDGRRWRRLVDLPSDCRLEDAIEATIREIP
jgi:oligoribonuclease